MTAFAATPKVPLLLQVVIVHPAVLQFLFPFALSQSVAHTTHPGEKAIVEVTTALVAKAELLVVLESLGLLILTLNVTLVPPAAGNGITGILTVSDQSEAIVVVFVQVTVVPTWAPQFHPLSLNAHTGPEIVVGRVNTIVCKPLEVRLPALVSVIGN